MSLYEIIEQSYQAFLERMPDTRVILLHPESRYRTMLVARLVDSDELNTYYYALGPDDINLKAFITGITHDLADQFPTFGRHINMLPHNVYENPLENFETILETFARDLDEISSDDFLLILDEYDRSDISDDVQRFIERLSAEMPPQCRIVLNGRTLPRLPWIAMISAGRAVMLTDGDVLRDHVYDIPDGSDGKLEVFAFGPGFVLRDGEPIDTWEGHLPRLLFFFSMDRAVVTRSEICGAFWPELDTDQAVNVFHVTKRRLHKALDLDILVHGKGVYYISKDITVTYDIMDFVIELMRGRYSTDKAERMEAWQKAADLYRGPFLYGHSDPWIKERRAEFRAGYLEALTSMAHVRLDEGKQQQALALFLKSVQEDVTRDDLHQIIMNLYYDMGRRSEAVSHYLKVVDLLENDDLEPSAETTALYEKYSVVTPAN